MPAQATNACNKLAGHTLTNTLAANLDLGGRLRLTITAAASVTMPEIESSRIITALGTAAVCCNAPHTLTSALNRPWHQRHTVHHIALSSRTLRSS